MGDSDEKHIAVRGPKRVVEYAIYNGEMPARKFLLEEVDSATRNHILAIFRHMAHDTERKMTDKMFCQERGPIHSFKSRQDRRQIRIPCFRHDNRWIVTHGFYKPGSAWDEGEFTLATKIMNAVLSQQRR